MKFIVCLSWTDSFFAVYQQRYCTNRWPIDSKSSLQALEAEQSSPKATSRWREVGEDVQGRGGVSQNKWHSICACSDCLIWRSGVVQAYATASGTSQQHILALADHGWGLLLVSTVADLITVCAQSFVLPCSEYCFVLNCFSAVNGDVSHN